MYNNTVSYVHAQIVHKRHTCIFTFYTTSCMNAHIVHECLFCILTVHTKFCHVCMYHTLVTYAYTRVHPHHSCIRTYTTCTIDYQICTHAHCHICKLNKAIKEVVGPVFPRGVLGSVASKNLLIQEGTVC